MLQQNMIRRHFELLCILIIFACFSTMVSAQNQKQECLCKNNGSCVSSLNTKSGSIDKFCDCKDQFIGAQCQIRGNQLKDQKQLPFKLNNQAYQYYYINMQQENIYAFFFHLCFDQNQFFSSEHQNQNHSVTFFFQIQQLTGYFDVNQNATHPVTIQFQKKQTCKNIFIHYTPLAKTFLAKVQKIIFAVKYGQPIKKVQKNNRVLTGKGQLNLKLNNLDVRVLQTQDNDIDIKISRLSLKNEETKQISSSQVKMEEAMRDNGDLTQNMQQAEKVTLNDQKLSETVQNQSQNSHKFKTQRTFRQQQNQSAEASKEASQTYKGLQQGNIPLNKNKVQTNKKSQQDTNFKIKQRSEQVQALSQSKQASALPTSQKKAKNEIKSQQNQQSFVTVSTNQLKKQANNLLNNPQLQNDKEQSIQQEKQNIQLTSQTIQKLMVQQIPQAIISSSLKKQTQTQIKSQATTSQSSQSNKQQIQQNLFNQLLAQQTQSISQIQQDKIAKDQRPKRIQKKILITAMVYPFFDQDLIFNLLFSFTSIAGLLVLGAMGYMIRNRIIGIRYNMRIAARQKNNLSHFQDMVPPQTYANFPYKQQSQQECSICLTSLIDNDIIRHTPCLHIFHMTCLDSWCQQNLSCPMCRRSLKQNSTGTSSILQVNITEQNIQIN